MATRKNSGLTSDGGFFRDAIDELAAALAKLGAEHREAVVALADDIATSWRAGGRFLVCGNGGSAADSQHIVAELVGRFMAERRGYPAIALTTDSSILTAVANDYGFEQVFARQVQALGGPNDVLLVISTSGNSANCVAAVIAARDHGMKAHGFLGRDGGKLVSLVDGAMVAPSDNTPVIQEIHITMGHLLCMYVEQRLETASG